MIQTIQDKAKEKMQKSIRAFEEDLSKQRVGPVTPSILQDVRVPYYGTPTPLSQVASIAAEGPLLLVVKPWEKHLLPEVEKAIRTADLGFNPGTSGDTIRIPVPPLSEERRKELNKRVRTFGEQAKVAIRNIRRDANNAFKELLKDKQISEDDERRAQERVQKLTDLEIDKVDGILVHKEKELMEM